MATITSTQNGAWNTGSTWVGGVAPVSGDNVIINHLVTAAPGTAIITGALVNASGTLEFPPASTASIYSSLNIEIQGVLKMRPSSVSVIHTIRFTNINENNFVGGGNIVLASDVGLWVMGSGRLDLQGAVRKPWTNATATVAAGATSYSVTDLTGWQIGDEIMIVPTTKVDTTGVGFDDFTNLPIDPFMDRMERRVSTNIVGSTISFATPLDWAHNAVTSSITSAAYGTSTKNWKPEVANLTRNVRIEGTASGRSHIFIINTGIAAHNIQYVQFKHMGPRKVNPAIHGSRPALISGRYGLHFHHCDYNAQNSLVYGCVMIESGNRCFVPHDAHKITMSWNVAFDYMEEAWWWDQHELTHFVTWEDNLFAGRRYNGITSKQFGMLLNMGDGNVARRNVGVYTSTGDGHSAGAFSWEANSEGVWTYEDNLAHSNSTGLWVWQNTSQHHMIVRYCSYNNDEEIVHGAYSNTYAYVGGHVMGLVFIEATSGNAYGQVFKNMFIDANGGDYCVQVIDSPAPGGNANSNKMIQCVFRNYAVQPVETVGGDGPESTIKVFDLINCDIEASAGYRFDQPGYPYAKKDGWVARLQHLTASNNKTERIGQADVFTNSIADFAPNSWGIGLLGLLAKYYNGLGLVAANLAFTRYDSMLTFQQWRPDDNINPLGVHHLITNNALYSIEWTGQIEAQYTGSHYFEINAPDVKKMWIDVGGGEVQIINTGFGSVFSAISSLVSLTTGVKYNIRLQHENNSNGDRGFMLNWFHASMNTGGYETVPHSQLFSPTANTPPTVQVGVDQTVTLPVTQTSVTATASDPGGSIASYAWTKISGPAGPSITSPTLATTTITGLVAGTFVYQCLVTDNLGLTATDQLTITVVAAPNVPPSVNEGPDQFITLPTSQVTLEAIATDTDGTIASYLWTRLSGPNVPTITTPTAANTTVTGLIQGLYEFQIVVTDNGGATANGRLFVTVSASTNVPPVFTGGTPVDKTITAPTDFVNVAVTASDSDGSIAAYLWTRVSGPNTPTIVTPTAASTNIIGLIPGAYVFQIRVTDDGGAIATDTVNVTVNPEPAQPLPRKVLISRSRRPL